MYFFLTYFTVLYQLSMLYMSIIMDKVVVSRRAMENHENPFKEAGGLFCNTQQKLVSMTLLP